LVERLRGKSKRDLRFARVSNWKSKRKREIEEEDCGCFEEKEMELRVLTSKGIGPNGFGPKKFSKFKH